MTPLRTRRVLDPEKNTVRFETEIGSLGPDETLLVFAEEDVARVPPVPLALGRPRRAFATRNWALA